MSLRPLVHGANDLDVDRRPSTNQHFSGGITIKYDDKIYIAPSGVQKERIQPSHLYILPASPSEITFPIPKPIRSPPPHLQFKPSQCTPLFYNAYTMRHAGAVIHTHSQNAVMVTLLASVNANKDERNVFRITHQEMIKGIRKVSENRNYKYWETIQVPIVENTAEEEDLKERMAIVRSAGHAKDMRLASCHSYIRKIQTHI